MWGTPNSSRRIVVDWSSALTQAWIYRDQARNKMGNDEKRKSFHRLPPMKAGPAGDHVKSPLARNVRFVKNGIVPREQVSDLLARTDRRRGRRFAPPRRLARSDCQGTSAA